MWNPVVEVQGVVPEPRYGHSAVVTGLNTMVIFGGQLNETFFYNDVGVYDMVSDTWLARNFTGEPPSRRAYHTAVVDR